jgi:hypothetical protein
MRDIVKKAGKHLKSKLNWREARNGKGCKAGKPDIDLILMENIG